MKYYDIRARREKLRAVNIIIGGRGIGKTYSALSFMLEQKEPFIYLRNTAVQMDECGSLFGNPFKRIAKDTDRVITMKSEKRHYMIYDETSGSPELIGYGAALSTFQNLRGVDLSDVRYCVFDEFIENRNLTFDQFSAFQGFYETVNRNRELAGEDPFKVILLSNSQTLRNPILSGYGLIERIQQMVMTDQRLFIDRDMLLELPKSEVSEAKHNTANYRLISGTAAAREALDNEFTRDSFKNVKKQNITEFRPLCMIDCDAGMIAYWKHKSEGRFYACGIPSWNCKTYDKDQYTLFLREYGLALAEADTRGKMWYENYNIKVISDNILRI